jgi:hypothetical protein
MNISLSRQQNPTRLLTDHARDWLDLTEPLKGFSGKAP